jgi:hypothetical protein
MTALDVQVTVPETPNKLFVHKTSQGSSLCALKSALGLCRDLTDPNFQLYNLHC